MIQRRPYEQPCNGKCEVCQEFAHHWLDEFAGPETADHPALVDHGLLAWKVCKHCEAWCADVCECGEAADEFGGQCRTCRQAP